MRTKYISLAMLATVFAASCSNEEVVETNVDPIGEAIDFRPSVVSKTRAVTTILSNLGDFNVIAKGIHSNNGELYKTFMVGNTENNGDIIPALAKRKGQTDAIWELTTNVYWPSDIESAIFWAFTDRNTDDKPTSGSCVTNGSVSFLNTNGPQINEYKPAKADLTKPIGENQGWFDGDYQRDLVSAFKQQTKNPHVSLEFHHLLSQVKINALSKHAEQDVESRVVKIKGAWLMNVKAIGNLNAGFTYDATKKEAKDTPVWTSGSTLDSYGAYYDADRTVPIVVNETTTSPLNIVGANSNGSLMLIPQNLPQWNGTDKTTTGSYLLLLCRVDLGHKGEVTVNPDEEAVSETNKDGVHYHQQFPVMKKYDPNAYGLTAVPVPVNWEIGKVYEYKLNVCGEDSGAGMYPPNVPTSKTELEKYLAKILAGEYKINGEGTGTTDIITTIPEGKGIGDYVLDDPIQFTVSVEAWGNGDTWTSGNDKTNTVSE